MSSSRDTTAAGIWRDEEMDVEMGREPPTGLGITMS